MPVVVKDSVLLCPHCQSINLHHGKVVLTLRDREDSGGLQVTVDASIEENRADTGPARVTTQLVGNEHLESSDRRNSFMINFRCEGCARIATMKISQHKGSTLVAWV